MNAKAPTFLTAEWRDLVMLSFEIDPSVLAPLVPRGTELDPWGSRHLVSIVGFRFLRTRVVGIPIPAHRDFEDVNFRFNVRHAGADGWRRGVVFIKEIVPRRAVAWMARLLYNENFVAMPMKHELTERRASVSWRFRGHWNSVSLETAGDRHVPDEGSEEAFITDHPWGYTRQRDGGTLEYEVEHPRWTVRRAAKVNLSCDVSALYGPQFVPFLSAAPFSAFIADGSPVVVRRGTRLPL